MLAVPVCIGDSGDGRDLWVLFIQGWIEISYFRQETNEEGLLHSQSWNATLPFPGATAIFGDGEGLPWSSHEVLKIDDGVSMISRKFTNSSTEDCAHSAAGSQVKATAPQLQQSLCLAAGVPPEQHPHPKRQRKILITAFNPPAFHMAGRASGFLEGWSS